MAIADQVPVNSGLGAKSTGAEVPADRELAGQVALVTGGYSGIGLETVRALAARGVRVTTLWAATNPLLAGKPGVYCEDCDIARPTDPASPLARYRGVEAHACDDEAAERLWTHSERMLAGA